MAVLGALPRRSGTVSPTRVGVPPAPYINPETGLPWVPGLYSAAKAADPSISSDASTDDATDPYKIPVYQIKSQDAPDVRLQDVYGTSELPMHEWVKKVQTGEIEIEPWMARELADTSDFDLAQQGISPTTKDMIIEGAAGLAHMYVGRMGKLAADTGQPFADQLGAAGKSFLPSWVTGSSKADVTDAAKEKGIFGEGYAPGWGQSAATFGISFAADIAAGKPAAKAAKDAAATTAGMYIGTAFGGQLGGFVGASAAKMIFGRVICNELWKQGHMSKEMVLDDYRFTRDFLSPQTVRGYHAWAIPVVRQMRKGRLVRLFKHIGIHRANEIAYIYGKRDKPDYLGKVYRQLLEKSSWIIGLFCEVSDWSILYKEKEI